MFWSKFPEGAAMELCFGSWKIYSGNAMSRNEEKWHLQTEMNIFPFILICCITSTSSFILGPLPSNKG